MTKILILMSALVFSHSAWAKAVESPIEDVVSGSKKSGEYYKGRSYYEWFVDINHNGIKDVLICEKQRPDEIEIEKTGDPWFFNADDRGLNVYIGLAAGGYVTGNPIEGGRPGAIGIRVNVEHCYVGYVKEINGYGLVTVESLVVDDPDEPQARHGVLKHQIVCYTVRGDHLKRTNLTPQFTDGEKNATFEKYLSESRRTKVSLQEVTP